MTERGVRQRSTAPTGPRVRVHGRRRELALVVDLVGGLAGARGAALTIEGYPGLGKTTLLDVAAEQAGRHGLRSVRVSGSAQTSGSPWALAAQLVEQLDRACARSLDATLTGPARRALDVLGPTATIGTPFPIINGVACAFRDLALIEPTLVSVDDAHLADPLSLAVLAALARQVESSPLGLLIAHRPPPNTAMDSFGELDVALSAGGARRVWLEALDDESIRAIVADRLSDASEELRDGIARVVAGSPLLARESADLCARHRDDHGEPAVLTDALDGDSAIVRRSTLARLGAAGASASTVATAIAVLGRMARVDRVATVAGISARSALAVVDDLVRCDLVVIVDRRPVIRHPLIEEMLVVEAGQLRIAAMHAAAARVLHAEGVGDEVVVEHLLAGLGAAEREPWMVATLRRAASRQLGLGTPHAAAELLARAAELCVDADERIAVGLELARAEAAAGRDGVGDRLDALVAGDAATRVPLGENEALVLAEIAEAQYATGRFAESEQTCDRALGALGLASATVREALETAAPRGVDSTLLVARLLAGRASAALLAGHGSRLDPTLDQLVAEQRHAAPPALRLLAAMRAGERALGVDVDPAHLQLLIDTAGLDEALPDALVRPVYEPVGTALAMAGRSAEAEVLLTRLLDRAAESGELAAHVSLLPVRGYAALRQGRIAEALADAEDALRLARTAPAASPYAAAPAIYVAVTAELERDRLDAASRLVRLDDAADRWGDSPLYGWFLCALGRVALAQGRPEISARAFSDAGAMFTASGGSGALAPWRSGLAQARNALGDRDAAEHLTTEERVAADAIGDVRLAAEARRVRATLITDHRAAAEQLADIATLVASVDDELALAQVETDQGCRLRRAGERRAARAVLARSFERASRIGAHRLERIAADELERAGARRPPRGLSGANALTPAELRVASLAASGCRNRDIADALFISLKTVESQLSSAYRKLGIAGREELAAALET